MRRLRFARARCDSSKNSRQNQACEWLTKTTARAAVQVNTTPEAYVFSANGAVSFASPGHRPGEFDAPREQALKARFIQLSHPAERESRFQRSRLGFHEHCGVATGSRLNAAPLALSGYPESIRDRTLILPKISRLRNIFRAFQLARDRTEENFWN